MKRNNHIVFVVALIILFISGDWATSARATEVSAFDFAPTPTGTPFGTPATPSGKVPSLKEQEQIKSVVQEYFDIRYRALSASEFSSARSLTEILRTICIFLTRAN